VSETSSPSLLFEDGKKKGINRGVDDRKPGPSGF